MSKTKFIKVSGKESPEQAGTYNTSHGVLNYSKSLNEFLNEKGESVLIESWFLEVPDREEEMRELIQEMILELDPATLSGDHEKLIKKAKQLLNK